MKRSLLPAQKKWSAAIAYVSLNFNLTLFLQEKESEAPANKIELIINQREAEDNGQNSFEYFVKWDGVAHCHNSWISERRLSKLAQIKLTNFLEKLEDEDEQLKEIQEMVPVWSSVDRIISKEYETFSP